MKTKTIKTILRRKLDAWLKTIDDEPLRKQIAANVIVTGGSIASMLLNEEVNDIDVYFRDYQTAFVAAKYYVGRFLKERPANANGIPVAIYLAGENAEVPLEAPEAVPGRIRIVAKSAGIATTEEVDKPYAYFESSAPPAAGDYVNEVMGDLDAERSIDKLDDVKDAIQSGTVEKAKYRPVFISTNAITLANQIQLIVRFYGEPDQIHENYDFVHCTNYYDAGTGKLVLRPDALETLLTKELRYIGSKYPVCSMIRVRKFVGRGWTINAGQVLKMAMQVSQLDLTNPKVLEEQLTGVDVAYFHQVLSAVNEKDPDKVDFAYLVEVIDRLF